MKTKKFLLSFGILAFGCLSVAAQGTLTGTGVYDNSTVNLSTGTTDWKFFYDEFGGEHSANANNTISDYTVIGGERGFCDSNRTISWSNGTITPSGSFNKGVFNAGIGNGFSFTAPAGDGAYTLKIYLGGWNSIGRLSVHLSNNAAPDYVNDLEFSNGTLSALYTIEYNAKQAGQTITVTWTNTNTNGNVSFQGASYVIHDTSTGVISNTIASTFSLYPNPAIGSVNLKTQSKGNISITDILGKVVLTKTVLENNTTVDISALNTGLYFVNYSSDGNSYSQKLMVK